jgi:primase-polymerase (primpol)-like protein
MTLDAIPEEMRARNQWVTWTTIHRHGKATKMPIDPKTGGPARTNNPNTWGSYTQAVHYFYSLRDNGAAGVGYVFSAQDPYTGIDLVHALVDGHLRWCAKILLDHLATYSEVSPSDTGVHALLRAQLPAGRHRLTLPCGLGIETYDRVRYFTMTGHHLPGTPHTIEDRQEALTALHRQLFAGHEKSQATGPGSAPSPTTDLDDARLISLALQAQNGGKFARLWAGDWQGAGYPSHSEGDIALAMKLAFWTGPDPARIERLFSQSGLARDKWQKRPDYRERTIREALARVRDFYQPGNNKPKPENTPPNDDGQTHGKKNPGGEKKNYWRGTTGGGGSNKPAAPPPHW